MPKGIYKHPPQCGFQKGNRISIGNKNALGCRHTKEWKRKMSLIHKGNQYCLGHKLTEEHKRKISEAGKGRKVSDKTKKKASERMKGHIFSDETKKKISETLKRKGIKPKVHFQANGKDNPAWLGGRTSESEKIRKSIQYKQWRELVFKRDNYICQMCGKRGIKIQVDHIKPFALFPELRFEVNNGRTLCIECHKKTDTHGWRTYNKLRELNKINYVHTTYLS